VRPAGTGFPAHIDRAALPGGFSIPGQIPQIGNVPSGIDPRAAGTAGAPRALDHLSHTDNLRSLAETRGRNNPTSALNPQKLVRVGDRVRNNLNFATQFRNWPAQYPGAWWAGSWSTSGDAYSSPSWSEYYAYFGYYSNTSHSASQPVYYDYGSNVVYDGDTVYVNGNAVATEEQYAQQATTIADMGKQTQATDDEDWLALGVFVMIQGEQVDGVNLFQLAVNRAGILRGNYYNALSDTTLPVYGAVNKSKQRVAWTIGDQTEPVFETGIANLIKSETTMLVHFNRKHTQQWILVRIDRSPSARGN
jgi:hypothetical protein